MFGPGLNDAVPLVDQAKALGGRSVGFKALLQRFRHAAQQSIIGPCDCINYPLTLSVAHDLQIDS
jgi:hypothetical protein